MKLTVDRIDAGNFLLVCDPQVEVDIKYVEGGEEPMVWVATNADIFLDVLCFEGRSIRTQIETEILSDWQQYAKAPDDSLSFAGLEKKLAMKARITEVRK